MPILRMVPILAFMTVVIAGLVGPPAAFARQPTAGQITAIRSKCPADYRSYCASVPPGGQAALACLAKNIGSLSAACKDAVSAATGAEPAPAAPAAASDGAASAPAAGTAAPTVAPAPPAASTAAPAAPAAAAAPQAVPALSPREELAIIRFACGPDVRSLCAGTPPGGGRIIACLAAHRASLSPRCVKALAGARQP